MTTASGRVATPISSAPARRTLQTTKVPRVEASTSTTMSRTRRRPAAVRHAACLRRREESNNRRERSACLVADAPHGDRKRPRRNAHFIGASSAHASNYQGSSRGSVHLDDDGVEQPKRTFCLLAAARGVERPLLCLVADAPHGDRKRPRRNAHFIGASSAHASNYQGSARGSVHLDDDGVEQPKRTFCLLAAARGVERPLLCLVADAPHGDRKRPRRNAHFIGASSAHASNYQGSARGSVHLDDDGSRTTEENVLPACVTHEAAACGRSPRCLLGQLRSGVSPTTVKAIYFSRAHHNC